MNFFKHFFDTFIPHADNGYKPHFFRIRSVLIVAAVIATLGLGAIVLPKTFIENSRSLAAVISSTIVDLTNADRQTNNLTNLAVSPVLERAAQMKADDMAKKGYFAHTSPEGIAPWYWFKEAGYAFTYAGENLAVRFSDSVDVERAWMNSPGHRANILNSHFKEIGIGIAEGNFQGQPTIFVVQMFGASASKGSQFPASAIVAAATTTQTKISSTTISTKQASSSVKGISTDESENQVALADPGIHKPAPEPVPKVIVENETFIAVKNEMATNSSSTIVAASTRSPFSFVQKLITSPRSVAGAVYILLSAIITLALITMIVIEVKHQHPKNIALGILLLLLIAGMAYLGQIFSPGALLVLST